ncbi:MAG: hypothetical protein PHR24_07405 [Oscillospiraceae bacterium]|nr:hypothetical protein [Oscillospiraceae bacterium]MDD3832288.1 hypothetical protein [Oscillospiraceae bacterium]MDD4547106.1 hypothetical protein [Oscillospiraceae bacterium]
MARSKKIRCTILLFLIGGAAYNILELIWRGYTHWSMFFVGGICFNLIGRIHTICKRRLVIRCVLCSLAISLIEFISGCIFNLCLKMNVWDYSKMFMNIKGQVCLLYSVLWGGLSLIALPIYRCCVKHLSNNKDMNTGLKLMQRI